MDAEQILPAELMRKLGTGHSSRGVIAASESNQKTHGAEGRGSQGGGPSLGKTQRWFFRVNKESAAITRNLSVQRPTNDVAAKTICLAAGRRSHVRPACRLLATSANSGTLTVSYYWDLDDAG